MYDENRYFSEIKKNNVLKREKVGEVRVIRIIVQIGILWLFYYAGVIIVKLTGIFIPASIIGLVLLWVAMLLNIVNVKWIQDGAGFMIGFLTLFFVPTTVGVIEYPELLTKDGALLVAAVVLSSIITIVLTGKVSLFVEKKENRSSEG